MKEKLDCPVSGKITSKNHEEIIEMDIFESQYPFVADIVVSLADVYFSITSDEACPPRASPIPLFPPHDSYGYHSQGGIFQ